MPKLKNTAFNPLNPCDYFHVLCTVPSRVDVAINSPYAVEAAEANAQRTEIAQGRRMQIDEFNHLAFEARAKGNLNAKQLKNQRKQIKAQMRELAQSQLAEAGL